MKIRLFLLTLISICFLSSCATTPIVHSWRPYTRTFTHESNVFDTDSDFHVQVICEDSPFLGSTKLIDDEIENLVTTLLRDRGLKVNQENRTSYNFRMRYRTEIVSHSTSSTVANSRASGINASQLQTGNATSNTIGVIVASLVSANRVSANNTVVTSNSTKEYYKHTIALEIVDADELLQYKSDVIWETTTPDIRSRLTSSMRYILNSIPTGETPIKKFPKLKINHLNQYFKTNCSYTWFINPVIPYRIKFMQNQDGGAAKSALRNPETLPAVVHLIQSAEVAVPYGSRNYKNVTALGLWSTARLGGEYYIGNDDQPVRILVDLSGSSSGYTISKSWVASREEYSKFNQKREEWEKALIEYFDFYE